MFKPQSTFSPCFKAAHPTFLEIPPPKLNESRGSRCSNHTMICISTLEGGGKVRISTLEGGGKAMRFFSLIVTGVVRFSGDDWFVFRAMQWPSHCENSARPEGTKGRWRLRQSRAATAQGQSAAGRVGYDGPCKFNWVVDANRHSHMHV